MRKSHSIFDRLINRLDLLDATTIQNWMHKLAREKGLLDTILQTIHEGVLIIDKNLKIQYVNNAAINLLGLPDDVNENDNHSINRYIRGVDWDSLISQDLKKWFKASRLEIEVFYPIHRYLQFYLIPYKNEAEDYKTFEGLATIILNDVTEFRNRAESKMESEKLKTMTMLAAGVAHEIGNPLNSLTIHLQLLQRMLSQTKENSEGHELLKISLEEVNRLDSIINRFLKAIRPSKLELKPLSLKDTISDSITFMKKEIEDRGIFVEGSWPKDIPVIYGDDAQLKQVFYNIIKNALQSMPEGGLLQVSLSVTPDFIQIIFVDNGKGIAPEELGNIFNPYYTTKDDGSGLGLMIVERIIREHNGELGVESGVEKGTTINIKLPRWDKTTNLLEPPAQPVSIKKATDIDD